MSITYKNIKCVPKESFIGKYMHAMRFSETPHIYDFWSTMWMLSSLVPRHVIVPRPYSPVHLNLYLMFISDSGISRKSSAINAAFTCLRSVMPDGEYVTAREGPEHLEHRLIKQREQDESRVVICVSELMRFLGRQAYTSSMPGLLTDLYDCPDHGTSGFLKGSDEEFRNVYITMLAGSTPSWLAKAVNPSVIEGGFTSRVFFIVTDRKKQLNPWYDGEVPSLKPALRMLVDCVNEVSDIGEVPMTPNAIEHYKTWYKKLLRSAGNNPYTKTFVSRQHDHVLRVAALLAINSQEYSISEGTLRWGINLVADVREMGLSLFGGGHPQSRMARAVTRITEILIANGNVGVQRTELRHRLRGIVSLREFDDIMDLCIEAEVIIAAEVPHIKGSGRPATYYFATDALRKGETRDTIIDELST